MTLLVQDQQSRSWGRKLLLPFLGLFIGLQSILCIGTERETNRRDMWCLFPGRGCTGKPTRQLVEFVSPFDSLFLDRKG